MVAEANQFDDADRAAVRGAAFVDGLAIPLLDGHGRRLGPSVLAISPDRLNLLVLYGSPISEGGLCTRLRLLQALWILSPGFRLNSPVRFAFFRWRWAFRSFRPSWRAAVAGALMSWHRLQFIDVAAVKVSKDGVDGEAPERWLAGYVLGCVRQLGFTEGEVRRMPYARLLQYQAELEDRSDADRPRFNRKRDQKAKRYLERKLARQAAAEARK